MRGIVLGVALLGLLAGCIRSDVEPNHVGIRRVDVAAPVVTSGTAVLAVNVTLDNAGGESGDLRLVVRGYDTDTGLLVITNETSPGRLPGDHTATYEVRLAVPRQAGYRIEVDLFEDERIVRTDGLVVSNVGGLEPNLFETGIKIASMDFLIQNVSGRVDIEAKVYVTNEGRGDAKPLRLQLKAREVSTGLLSDEASVNVSGVPVEATKPFPVRLDVPQGYNYDVEAVLWDGDFVVGRGRGAVQLLPTYVKPTDTEIVVSRPNLADFAPGASDGRSVGEGYYESTEPAPAVPAPGALAALAAVALVAFLARSKVLRRR